MREVAIYITAHWLRDALLYHKPCLAMWTYRHLNKQLAIVGYLIWHLLIVQVFNNDIAARVNA